MWPKMCITPNSDNDLFNTHIGLLRQAQIIYGI